MQAGQYERDYEAQQGQLLQENNVAKEAKRRAGQLQQALDSSAAALESGATREAALTIGWQDCKQEVALMHQQLEKLTSERAQKQADKSNPEEIHELCNQILQLTAEKKQLLAATSEACEAGER